MQFLGKGGWSNLLRTFQTAPRQSLELVLQAKNLPPFADWLFVLQHLQGEFLPDSFGFFLLIKIPKKNKGNITNAPK
jgi:hypothetical protein